MNAAKVARFLHAVARAATAAAATLEPPKRATVVLVVETAPPGTPEPEAFVAPGSQMELARELQARIVLTAALSRYSTSKPASA